MLEGDFGKCFSGERKKKKRRRRKKKAVRKNLADIPVCKQPVWKINISCSLNKIEDLGFIPIGK